MKRWEILKRISERAAVAGVTWEVQREGANHTVYRLGASTVPIPRHVEIGPGLSEDIFKQCEPELGERWWR
jgi:hypothetical protein